MIILHLCSFLTDLYLYSLKSPPHYFGFLDCLFSSFFFIDSFLFPLKPSWFFFFSLATTSQILGFPQGLPPSSIFSGCGEPVLGCSWGGNIQWACLLVSQHDTGWCVSPISLVREMQAQVCRASDVRHYLGSHFTDELRGGAGMKTQAG